ncbi:MAG: TolC family protein [Gemmatimonadaceae bacterium]|nr:TolC family protein [Gemmatimonadaceae bacterium]
MTATRLPCAVALALSIASGVVRAQSAPDTLRLAVIQQLAERADPRAAQSVLLARQTELRLASLRTERTLPQVGLTATGHYLSDVAQVPIPGGFGPLNHQYDLYASVRQPVVDPAAPRRAALERAQLAEASAGVRSTLWQQRQLVSDVFFAMLLRESQLSTLRASVVDLTERRRVAAARVAAGSALSSDVALLNAELAKRAQTQTELLAEQDAARAVLSSLIGRPVSATTVLELPTVDSVLPAPGRDRPDFAQFAGARSAIDARAQLTSAQTLPRVSLTGRTGYGRPGLNALGRSFDTYYVAGLQVEWSPWNWGAVRRDREVQVLQAEILATREAAFADGIARAATADRARIAALAAGLGSDDAIIALRTQVADETRQRVDAGEATTADYVARQTELLSAQLDRDARRIRLAEARARYLTTIGREVR